MSDASAAPEPPCCSIVLRWQACHIRNTCLQSVCHGRREQVGYQLHGRKTFSWCLQRTSWAHYLGDTTKHLRFSSHSKRKDCCTCTLFLPSRRNDFFPTPSQVDVPPVRICGTGHDTVPLLFISKNASLFLANAQADIKNQLDWPGEREHLETFVFPRKSCSFIQDDTDSCSSVAITCCQTSMVLHVRLVLLGEEIVPVGTCEIPIASSTSDTDTIIAGLTCSQSGVLSFIGESSNSSVWHIGISCYRLAWNMGDISAGFPEFIPCLDSHFRKPSPSTVYHAQQQKVIGKGLPLRRIFRHFSRPARCIGGRNPRSVSPNMGHVLWSPSSGTLDARTIHSSFSSSQPHCCRRRASPFDRLTLIHTGEKNRPQAFVDTHRAGRRTTQVEYRRCARKNGSDS